MKRRKFIKLSGAVAGGAVVASPVLLTGCGSAPPPPGSGVVKATPTVCAICFWKCAGFVHTEDGQPWKITGNPEDLHSRGRLCTRGSGGMGSYLDRDRLKRPLIRVKDGSEETFKEVSWEEALDYVAGKMKKIAEEHGPDRMAVFAQGAPGSHFKHLMKAYGTGSFGPPDYAQCRAARDLAYHMTYGKTVSSPEPTDMANSRCIVLIGTHIGENLHNGQVSTFAQAINNRATIIVVDPRFSVAAGKAKYWLPIKPGTDMALLLAWMNVIVTESLYDKDYVERHTHGFDKLVEHVQSYTPEWAYLETGLEPELIRRTAREMAGHAPATLVHPGRHAAWYGDDTQRSRATAILNALLGSWGRPGGFYIPETVKLPKYPVPKYPKPASTFRVAHEGKYPLAYNGVSNALIEHSIGPDAFYKGWLVAEANLPLAVPGMTEKIRQAADSLELFVVIDTMPMEVTGYADVVLPECTYLERYDDLRNAQEEAPSLGLRMPAFPPKYDSKPGWWIARELGLRLGLEKYFPWKDYSEVLDWQLQQVGSSLAELQKVGVKNFPRKTAKYIPEGQDYRFGTPTGKIELYSTRLDKAGFDPMPRYTAPQKAPPGHYRLNYGRAPAHTFGRTSNNPLLFELMPENVVWINPLVASQWKLGNGDYVRLKNQDGIVSNPVRVRVTERTGPDAVFMVHGFGHTSKQLRLTHGVGASDADLITNLLMDPIMGATGMRSNFVTFIQEEA